MVERLITCQENGALPTLVKTWLDTLYTGAGAGGAVDSVNGQVGTVVLNKFHIGLGSVDNTPDVEKAVLSAAKLAVARTINGINFDGSANITIPTVDTSKEPLISAGTTAQYWRGDKTWVVLDKAAVGLANVDNTTDANKPVSAATQTALNLLAPKASPAFTGTPTGITKAHVGLGSVDNTADAAKAVLSATKLTTARAINGVNFDGTGNITIPTVDATKEPIIAAGNTAQYWRGDKSWQTLDKSAVGLSNVDNTSDLNKPVSTAQQAADSTREPTITAGTTAQFWRGDKSWQALNKAAVGLANVDNTTDAAKAVLSATKLATARTINGVSFDGTANITVADATKEPSLPVGGTTAHYMRGDKSWQTLDKVAIGLANVDNTADTAKPVSTATQTALNLLAPKASPAFTGTVTGVTAAMVGLGSVNNTTDSAKPVSTAQQTALDAKINTSGSALTLWSGTQAQYDAIGAKDSSTVYVVT